MPHLSITCLLITNLTAQHVRLHSSYMTPATLSPCMLTDDRLTFIFILAPGTSISQCTESVFICSIYMTLCLMIIYKTKYLCAGKNIFFCVWNVPYRDKYNDTEFSFLTHYAIFYYTVYYSGSNEIMNLIFIIVMHKETWQMRLDKRVITGRQICSSEHCF